MPRIVSILLLALTLVLAPLPVAAQLTPCGFVLGFAELRDQLGAELVGDCLEDQQGVDNGDARQRTDRGVLLWRAADGATLFTDGSTTWVKGPFDLQARAANERFDWEPPAVAVVPPPLVAAPPPAPPSAPAPSRPTEPDPSLASRCFRVSADLILDLAPHTGRGSGDLAAGALRELNAKCRQAAANHGPKGVDCFEWAYRRALRQAPLAGGSAVGAAKALYRGCVGGR